MLPTGDQIAEDTGLRAIRQNNCLACHMVEPGTITFTDDDGYEHTVVAELLPIGDEPQPPAHTVAALRDEMEYWEEEEVIVRLLRDEPGFGAVGDKLFIDSIDQVVGMTPPQGGDFIRVVTDYYYNGQELFDPEAEDPDDAWYGVTADPDGDIAVEDVDGVFRPFYDEAYDKVRWTYAPPVLWDEGGKVNKGWFYAFLNDVHPIRPQIRVRMPSFNYREGQAAAIADYFALKSAADWPATFTRRMLRALDLSTDDVAEAEMTKLKPGGSAGDHGRRSGHDRDRHARDPGVRRVPGLDRLRTGRPAPRGHLAPRAGLSRSSRRGRARTPHHRETLAIDAACFQCHFRLETPPPADPIAWAPDLSLARERLREDWTQRWLINPARIYPGTSMPQNFADNAADYHGYYPDSTNAEQIETVLDWLFNFDRVYMASQN